MQWPTTSRHIIRTRGLAATACCPTSSSALNSSARWYEIGTTLRNARAHRCTPMLSNLHISAFNPSAEETGTTDTANRYSPSPYSVSLLVHDSLVAIVFERPLLFCVYNILICDGRVNFSPGSRNHWEERWLGEKNLWNYVDGEQQMGLNLNLHCQWFT